MWHNQLTYISPNNFKIVFCISLWFSVCFLGSLIASNLVYWRHQQGAACLVHSLCIGNSFSRILSLQIPCVYSVLHVSPQNNKWQVCNFFDKQNKFSKQNYLSEFPNLSVIELTSAQYRNQSQHDDSNDWAPNHPTPTFKLVRRCKES